MASSVLKGKQIITSTVRYSSAVNIEAKSYKKITLTLTKTGYKPLAVIGMSVPDTDVFSLGEVSYGADRNTASVIIWNHYTASREVNVIDFDVLYERA